MTEMYLSSGQAFVIRESGLVLPASGISGVVLINDPAAALVQGEGAYQFLFGDRPVQIAQRLVKRVLSIIQQEVIDVFEEAGIRDGAKFRIHETASHKDRYRDVPAVAIGRAGGN